MRTIRNLRARVDAVHFYSPYLAAIEGTLPRGVPTCGRDDARLRVLIDALKVGDDLKLLPEEICKQGGFGAGSRIPAVPPVFVGRQV